MADTDVLRRWYGHDPARFAEFARRYRCELEQPERSDALAHLRQLASRLPSPYAPSPRTDTMMALALAAAGPILPPVDQTSAPR